MSYLTVISDRHFYSLSSDSECKGSFLIKANGQISSTYL